MKKVIGVIVVLGIVIGAAALFMTSKKEETVVPVTAKAPMVVTEAAQYLPADTVSIFTFHNIRTMTTALPESPFGRLLKTETVLAVMREAKVDPELQQQYAESVKDMTDFFTNPSFQLLFGDTVTLATLPLDLDAFVATTTTRMADLDADDDEAKDPAPQPPDMANSGTDGKSTDLVAGDAVADDLATILGRSTVAIATTRSPATLQVFTTLNPNLTVTPEEFDSLTLLKIILPNKKDSFYGYIDGNNVLLSPARETIRACLNTKTTGANLNTNPWLTQAGRYWAAYPSERTYVRAYMNIQSIMRSISAAKHPELTEAFNEAEVKQLIELYQGMEYMCCAIYTTDQSLNTATLLSVDPDKLHPAMMKKAFQNMGNKNTSLHLLDRQPVFYGWGTPLNLEYMLDTCRTDPQMAQMIDSGVQNILGLTPDEVVASLGPRYGFTLDTIVDTGLFPIPKLSLWFEVRDKEKVEKAIDHIKQVTTAQGNAPSEEEVSGTTMVHWLILPGDAGQPAVALHKDTLYLSSSVNLMKAILSNTADPVKVPAAVREKLGPEWSKKLESANSSACVAYPSQFTGPLLNTIDFANNTQGGTLPVRRLKTEVMTFLNAMDHVAGYCNVEDKQISCAATIKWAPQNEAVSP